MAFQVNGNDYSFGSLRLKINGKTFSDFKKISFASKRTRTKGYGAGRHRAPTKRSAGKYEVDPVKITGYPDGVVLIKSYLASIAPDETSYATPEFQSLLTYGEPGKIYEVVFQQCAFDEDGGDHAEETDLLEGEFTLDVMRIDEYDFNGKLMTKYDSSEGLPQ